MNLSLHTRKNLIIFGFPLVLIASLILLSSSSIFKTNSKALSLAITADLLLTIPFIYYLLIRKTSIPKTTVIPFIILGVIVGTFILPEANQNYLNLFKTYALPLLELGVLGFVIYKVRKAIQRFKQKEVKASSDFFTILKATCYDILPRQVVIPVVTEISVLYYGFMYWKKRQLKSNEFSYHKNTGSVSLLLVFIFIIAIETVTVHFLLVKWNLIVAWIVTGLSVYTGIQILGFVKSILKRPIIVDEQKVYLRYGIMNETIIDIKDIASVELTTKHIELNKTTRKLSFLGDLETHNTIITLKHGHTLTGLYGIKRPYTILVLNVDKNVAFKDVIDAQLKRQEDQS